MRKLICLAFVLPWTAAGESQAPALRLEPVRKLGPYPDVARKAIGLTWDRSGVLWSYGLEDFKTHLPRLYRFIPGVPEATEIRFDLAQAGIPSPFEIVPNLFARGDGDVFFPVVWRDVEFQAAVVRVSAGGRVSSVRLMPPVMARHVAVRDDGSFVVLGIDGGFFSGRENRCHLLHVYSADGRRLDSLSPCPDHGVAGSSASRREGVDFHLLQQDVDPGQLWLDGDRLCHLLPASREIRIFSASHLLLRTIRLQAPDSGARGLVVRRLLPLQDGYLVFWMSRRGLATQTETVAVVAALHDLDGGLRSRPASAREFGSLRPVAVTEHGELICWQQDTASGNRYIVTARVALWR
ncbi:MAG TPA: hypothetical protein VNJ11_16865 [Bryobacteraceae bacterium]|nr:hypothetical protein [Bryobacteraceae bacterium]